MIVSTTLGAFWGNYFGIEFLNAFFNYYQLDLMIIIRLDEYQLDLNIILTLYLFLT